MHHIKKIASFSAMSIAFMLSIPIHGQEVRVYFSKSVDTALCESLGIETLPDGWNVRLDSLLATYIDSADYSVDMCVYRWSFISTEYIMPAIHNALERDVKFRVVLDNDAVNDEIADTLAMLGIPYIDDLFGSEPSFNYMHCKFFIVDGRNTDTTDDIAIISSSNITYDNIFNDANNTVVVHWSSVAQILSEQFNTYWGTPADSANADSSSFRQSLYGIANADSILAEIFFSPQKPEYEDSILSRISNCQNKAYFCINRFSRNSDIDDTLREVFYRGTEIKGVFGYRDDVYHDMVGDNTDEDTIFNWNPNLSGCVFGDGIPSGVIHSKYLIGDVNHSESDPFVLTGSMNWSYNGFYNNNECIFIIHSYEVSQKYFAEFATRYVEAGGSLDAITSVIPQSKPKLHIFPNPTTGIINIVPSLPVQLFDLRGKMVGKFSPPIELKKLPAGTYIIKYKDGNEKIRIIR